MDYWHFSLPFKLNDTINFYDTWIDVMTIKKHLIRIQIQLIKNLLTYLIYSIVIDSFENIQMEYNHIMYILVLKNFTQEIKQLIKL